MADDTQITGKYAAEHAAALRDLMGATDFDAEHAAAEYIELHRRTERLNAA